jgi:hypothetical protein
VAVVAAVDDPAVPGTLEPAVVRLQLSGSTVTAETVVAKAGDVLAGQTQPAVGFGTGLHQLAVNAAGDVLFFVDLAGDRTADGAIYRSGTLVAQEGSPAPDPGRSYERLSSRALDLNDAGDTLFRADLNASTADDEVVVVSDSIVVREGDDPISGPIGPIRELGTADSPSRLDSGGNAIYCGRANPSNNFTFLFAVDKLASLGPNFPTSGLYTVDSLDVREIRLTAGGFTSSRSNGNILYFARTGPGTASVDGFALITNFSAASPVGAPGVPEPAPGLTLRAFPSPSGGVVHVRFALDRAGPVQLRVFDVAGRLVSTLTDRAWPAGEHAVAWSGTDSAGRRAAAGTYFVRLRAGARDHVSRVTLVE